MNMVRYLTLAGAMVALTTLSLGYRGPALGVETAVDPTPNQSAEVPQDQLLAMLRSGRWVLKGNRTIYLRFITPDRVAGSGGCNRFSGGFTLKGDRLTLGPLAATKRACLGDRMIQENEFFRLTSGTHLVRLNRNELSLEHLETKTSLVFQRRS
ncbi:MAG: META domain-containing protein [Oscillatoriales cyanobacterium SM2_2_1]|nr:META domain-containing protein [Oscillatoriales cyanobacterium SM2_2_1]